MIEFIVAGVLTICQTSGWYSDSYPRCKGLKDKFIAKKEIVLMEPFRYISCKKHSGHVDNTNDYSECSEGSGVGCTLTLKDGTKYNTLEYCGSYQTKTF